MRSRTVLCLGFSRSLGFHTPELDYKREEQGVLGVTDNAGCRWQGARRTLPRYLGLTPKQVSNHPC